MVPPFNTSSIIIMAQPRFQIKLREITDRHSLSLLQSLYQAKSSLKSTPSHSNIGTAHKRTFLLNEEQQVIQQQSMKSIKYIREVSFDTIQFILSVLSCVFSLLVVYTNNIDSDFLYTSISISTLAIQVTLICKYVLAEKAFRVGQIVEIVAYGIHPNLLTPSINGHLHLVLLCRLHIVFKYILRSRVYLNIRTDRVVESNGSSPSGMVFALKAQLVEMGNKTLLLIYGVAMLILSHCLYVATNLQEPIVEPVKFGDCIFSVAQTMTLIGFMNHFQSDTARIIAILSLITGQCLNSTMILINVRSLTMSPEEKNAHELSQCLIQRQELQKSAVKLLQFNHKFKNDRSMNHPSEYHKIALQIRTNRKNLYRTTRIGVVQNLSMTFMQGCFRLKEHTKLTYNYIHKILSVLKKWKGRPFKSVKFIERLKQERKQESEGSENQFAIHNTEVNRKYRRSIRRVRKAFE